MITPDVSTVGRLAALSPRWLLHTAACLIADFVLPLLPSWRLRHRIAATSLHNAFPGRSQRWRNSMRRESVRRTVECVMLSLAMPYLSRQRVRQIADLAPSFRPCGGGGAVFAVPHLVPWLAIAWLKVLTEDTSREFGVFFEPTRDPRINADFKRTYRQLGVQPLDGTEGMLEALRILRCGGWVGAFFDQDAGSSGVLSTLFGRLCMTSELPSFLAAKAGVPLHVAYARRLGFWRTEISGKQIEFAGQIAIGTIALNRWLEAALARDDRLCATWYWTYDRWKSLKTPQARFRLPLRRSLLPAEAAQSARFSPPPSSRTWVALPEDLGQVIQAIPVLRALKQARPDMHLTLLARRRFHPLLEAVQIGDSLREAPQHISEALLQGFRIRGQHPELWLVLADTARDDLLAWASGAPQRFGAFTDGRPRPLLTHGFRVPVRPASPLCIEVWEALLQRFGLDRAVNREPLQIQPALQVCDIGLLPDPNAASGSRWNSTHWQALASALPISSLRLISPPLDSGCESTPSRVAIGGLATAPGPADLAALAGIISSCRLLISDSVEAAQLANAIGIPAILLEESEARAAFPAPFRTIRSGGPWAGATSDVAISAVISAVQEMIGANLGQRR